MHSASNATKIDSTGVRRLRIRRISTVVLGIGVGAAVAYVLSRALGSSNEQIERVFADHIVDDRGTGQQSAAHILRVLRDQAFDASDEKLAVALGRPIEEIEAWNRGREVIDDDVVMKARGIAMHRGVRVE